MLLLNEVNSEAASVLRQPTEERDTQSRETRTYSLILLYGRMCVESALSAFNGGETAIT